MARARHLHERESESATTQSWRHQRMEEHRHTAQEARSENAMLMYAFERDSRGSDRAIVESMQTEVPRARPTPFFGTEFSSEFAQLNLSIGSLGILLLRRLNCIFKALPRNTKKCRWKLRCGTCALSGNSSATQRQRKRARRRWFF